MAAEEFDGAGERFHFNDWIGAAGAGVLEPEGAIVGEAVAGCAEVNSDAADVGFAGGGVAHEGPHLDLCIGNQGEGSLDLVAARTRAGVIRGAENAAGDDQVIGATGAEAAKISGAAESC